MPSLVIGPGFGPLFKGTGVRFFVATTQEEKSMKQQRLMWLALVWIGVLGLPFFAGVIVLTLFTLGPHNEAGAALAGLIFSALAAFAAVVWHEEGAPPPLRQRAHKPKKLDPDYIEFLEWKNHIQGKELR